MPKTVHDRERELLTQIQASTDEINGVIESKTQPLALERRELIAVRVALLRIHELLGHLVEANRARIEA